MAIFAKNRSSRARSGRPTWRSARRALCASPFWPILAGVVRRPRRLRVGGREKPGAMQSRGPLPRTADGHPDLQGNWTNGDDHPLERPEGRAGADEGEADRLEKGTRIAPKRSTSRAIRNRPAPPKGGDGSTGAAGNVGGYNNFWLDPGDRVAVVNGEWRSSLIVDPPNGKVPALTEEARAAAAPARAARTRGRGQYDHPELRPLGERCLMSFGSNAGPPMLPNYFYNNNYQIVQTKDHVMILIEMVHDARSSGWGVTTRPRASALDGRFDRPLGRRYARRRDDELPSAAELPGASET